MPETITEEQYQAIRADKDADPVLAGFVGFGCSFGGKWFGGYARNKGGTNYAAQSKRSLLKDMATLGGAEIFCGDYKQVPIPPGAVVYADPPYDNTTGYNNEKFNSTEFWQAMRLLADTGHTVYISEQTAPPDFVCVWEKPFTRTLDRNKGNQFKVTEKLFTYISPIWRQTMIPFPNKKYSVIYADPPWSYQDKRCNGNAADHYPTMRIEDICSLPVQDLAADNCVLFLWATYPMLKEALKVIEAWGFKYKSIGFQWVKQNRSGNGYFFGLGRWTRGNTEPCLIAVKGKPHRASNSVSQLIFAPLRAHSQKPDITRDKIRELMGGDHSYIELFARNTTPGWDVWGNEVNKYGN